MLFLKYYYNDKEANGSAESQSYIVPHENLLDISTNSEIEEKLTKGRYRITHFS